MFCPKCGSQNEEDAKFCEACGSATQVDSDNSNTALPHGDSQPHLVDFINGFSIAGLVLLTLGLIAVVIAVGVGAQTIPPPYLDPNRLGVTVTPGLVSSPYFSLICCPGLIILLLGIVIVAAGVFYGFNKRQR